MTVRLTLPPIDAGHLATMRSGEHQDRWAEDFPTAGDAMIADMYSRTGLPDAEADELFGHRLVVERETGLVVGGVGVKGPAVDGVVEIGYGLAPSRQGRGYATEAVAALVAALLAHPQVHSVTAQVAPANGPSVGVLVRSGFRHVGRRDEHDWYCLDAAATS